jgi:hypothetical protein
MVSVIPRPIRAEEIMALYSDVIVARNNMHTLNMSNRWHRKMSKIPRDFQ